MHYVTVDNSTLRIAYGLYPISDNCVRDRLFDSVVEHWIFDPGSIPIKVMGFFQPNLLFFVTAFMSYFSSSGIGLNSSPKWLTSAPIWLSSHL